jgi:hypothetical protein
MPRLVRSPASRRAATAAPTFSPPHQTERPEPRPHQGRAQGFPPPPRPGRPAPRRAASCAASCAPIRIERPGRPPAAPCAARPAPAGSGARIKRRGDIAGRGLLKRLLGLFIRLPGHASADEPRAPRRMISSSACTAGSAVAWPVVSGTSTPATRSTFCGTTGAGFRISRTPCMPACRPRAPASGAAAPTPRRRSPPVSGYPRRAPPRQQPQAPHSTPRREPPSAAAARQAERRRRRHHHRRDSAADPARDLGRRVDNRVRRSEILIALVLHLKGRRYRSDQPGARAGSGTSPIFSVDGPGRLISSALGVRNGSTTGASVAFVAASSLFSTPPTTGRPSSRAHDLVGRDRISLPAPSRRNASTSRPK